MVEQYKLTYVNIFSCKYIKKNANLFGVIDPYQ